jgi:hypothetical protein
VHPRPKRLLHLLQFRFQPLPRRLPPDGEIPATVRPASMREPQKRETFRLSFTTFAPVCPRKPAKLGYASIVQQKADGSC